MTSPSKPGKWTEEDKKKVLLFVLDEHCKVSQKDFTDLSKELGRSVTQVYDQWRQILKPVMYRELGLSDAGTPSKKRGKGAANAGDATPTSPSKAKRARCTDDTSSMKEFDAIFPDKLMKKTSLSGSEEDSP